MTDPLDELKRAMDRATPIPDPARRAANLARAEEIFERAQGLAAAPRPTHDRSTGWAGLRNGAGRMFAALAARPALAATTGLAALSLIVLVPLIREGGEPSCDGRQARQALDVLLAALQSQAGGNVRIQLPITDA